MIAKTDQEFFVHHMAPENPLQNIDWLYQLSHSVLN